MADTKTITKSLAAVEDFALGVGTIQQNRAGQLVTVHYVHAFVPVASEALLANVDITKFTLGAVVKDGLVTYYQYTETAGATGISSAFGSGVWAVMLTGNADSPAYNKLYSFEKGNTLNYATDVLKLESNGKYYRWAGVLPKVVPAGSTPASTGGISPTAWVDVGDASLKGALASVGGAAMIGVTNPSGNPSTVAAELTRINNSITSLQTAAADRPSVFDIGARVAAGETIKIVIYGDSTVDGTNTTGWTANPTDASGNAIGGTDHNLTAPNTWPVYLQNILRDMFGSAVSVKNAGYGGKSIVTDWAINNYQKAVLDTYSSPNYVFISFGLNDVTASNFTIDLYYQKYSALINKVIESGAVPVVVTSDPVSYNAGRTTLGVQGEIVQAQRYIAAANGIQCLDINKELIAWQDYRNNNDRWAFHQDDGLHFSNLGHYKRAEFTAKLVSGLVIEATEGMKIAPWQGRQKVYPTGIFRAVNNFFSGCLNYSNMPNTEVLDFYIWCDKQTKLSYHSVDRDVSSASDSAANSSKIRITSLIAGTSNDLAVYFGAHGSTGTNRLSELPLDCGTLNHGINKITYVTSPVVATIASVGYFSITSVKTKTVNSVGTPAGSSYAVDINFSEMSDVLSTNSGQRAFRARLYLPVGFGAVLTRCRTFDNAPADVTLANNHTMLLLYRDTDGSVGLYSAKYDQTNGVSSVALLNKSAASIYSDGMEVEIRIGTTASSLQIMQVYNGAGTKIIEYTNPAGSPPIPLSGIPGGIFANKALATTHISASSTIIYN